MAIRVGICGVGAFGRCFVPLFKHHPLVENVILCDLDPEKLETHGKRHNIQDRCGSLDELCALDVDAIVLFTQHHLHGPQAVQALEAGKHVYSAVPAAISIEEITNLVRTVENAGRIYMVGETSYYYPCAIYCRDRFRKGDFGHIVYGEGEYHHEYSHGLIDVLKFRHGEEWEKYANWPPFFYPTHSTSLIVSVTGAHVTQVTGMGYEDRHEDGLFHRPDSVYVNHFSNETMLCRMSDGSMARINEFRRIGHPETVGMSLFGTEGCYEEHAGDKIWTTRDGEPRTNVSEELGCKNILMEGVEGEGHNTSWSEHTYCGVSSVHPDHLLPKEYKGLPNGHLGSHQFLVHDFVSACETGKLPPNNIWAAARYLVPGLTGHESALQGGVLMDVQDFGDPPGPVSYFCEDEG